MISISALNKPGGELRRYSRTLLFTLGISNPSNTNLKSRTITGGGQPYRSSFTVIRSFSAAWAAARRAMGTRKGEQLT